MTDLETCRALALGAGSAAMATMGSGEVAGVPYASLVLVAWEEGLRALLLLSGLAEHTRNLEADARASLLVVGDATGAEPLAAARMTVLGRCAPLAGAQADEGRTRFVAAHPEAAGYATFRDFRVFRLEPERVRLVAGFGRQAWIRAAELREA